MPFLAASSLNITEQERLQASSPSHFAIPLGPFIRHLFLGSFDVARVDIVFEVCVFDAYSSLETTSRGGKIMTQNKKKFWGLLTELCINSGLVVNSSF